MLTELLKKNRSYRRFFQEERIGTEELASWVANCRLCASGRNLQALKYVIVQSRESCEAVFPTLAWAGYLKDWNGPEEGERPAAYIIQILDRNLTENCLCDDGLQIQTVLLSAVESGFGGCIIKAFNNTALRRILQLPENLQINYVIALGRPKEKVVLEPMRENDVRYWRTSDGLHHVPKRSLEEILLKTI